MEGPSIYLARNQLAPFRRRVVLAASGNTRAGKERLDHQRIKDIFCWGKHLVFQFDDFALRIHFLLWGTYAATVEGKLVTGDYPRKARVPRLALSFENGSVEMFSCSVKFIETGSAKRDYDYSIDIMSRKWDPGRAHRSTRLKPDCELGDVLLDQSVFGGVGNIIKNEALWMAGIHPRTRVESLSAGDLERVIAAAHLFSRRFYRWRKDFKLRANLKIYRKPHCPRCRSKISRGKTGQRRRWSFWCPVCQPEDSRVQAPS